MSRVISAVLRSATRSAGIRSKSRSALKARIDAPIILTRLGTCEKIMPGMPSLRYDIGYSWYARTNGINFQTAYFGNSLAASTAIGNMAYPGEWLVEMWKLYGLRIDGYEGGNNAASYVGTSEYVDDLLTVSGYPASAALVSGDVIFTGVGALANPANPIMPHVGTLNTFVVSATSASITGTNAQTASVAFSLPVNVGSVQGAAYDRWIANYDFNAAWDTGFHLAFDEYGGLQVRCDMNQSPALTAANYPGTDVLTTVGSSLNPAPLSPLDNMMAYSGWNITTDGATPLNRGGRNAIKFARGQFYVEPTIFSDVFPAGAKVPYWIGRMKWGLSSMGPRLAIGSGGVQVIDPIIGIRLSQRVHIEVVSFELATVGEVTEVPYPESEPFPIAMMPSTHGDYGVSIDVQFAAYGSDPKSWIEAWVLEQWNKVIDGSQLANTGSMDLITNPVQPIL